LCLQLGFTAYAQLQIPQVAEAFTHLGFPAYFRVELAWAKLLGVVLLLAPVPARLKEWAYAGFAITLGSALIAHFSVGDGPEAWGLGGGHQRALGRSRTSLGRLQPPGQRPTAPSLKSLTPWSDTNGGRRPKAGEGPEEGPRQARRYAAEAPRRRQSPDREGRGRRPRYQAYNAAQSRLERDVGRRPRRAHRAHGPRRAQGGQLELALSMESRAGLVPQLPYVHEVHQGGLLPRHIAASCAPGASKHKEVRYLDIREDEPLDESSWRPGSGRRPPCPAGSRSVDGDHLNGE
jgi:hypothetical protein